MRFVRILAFGLFAMMTSAVFADAKNLLIAFSTQAPGGSYAGDTYANGDLVQDGEWYALCWSTNAVFGGFTSECEPAVEGDRLLLLAPLAKGGHCPMVVFQLETGDTPVGGNYFVYLLDTRTTSGAPSSRDERTGKPAILNGMVVTNGKATGLPAVDLSTRVVTDSYPATNANGIVWAESEAVADDVGQPVITAFQISGDRVSIKVQNMHPSIRYNIFAGETVGSITLTALEVPISSSDNGVAVDLPQSQGKFFKVARQPITK